MTYREFQSALAVFDALERAGAYTETEVVAALERGAVMMVSYKLALEMYQREVTN